MLRTDSIDSIRAKIDTVLTYDEVDLFINRIHDYTLLHYFQLSDAEQILLRENSSSVVKLVKRDLDDR